MPKRRITYEDGTSILEDIPEQQMIRGLEKLNNTLPGAAKPPTPSMKGVDMSLRGAIGSDIGLGANTTIPGQTGMDPANLKNLSNDAGWDAAKKMPLVGNYFQAAGGLGKLATGGSLDARAGGLSDIIRGGGAAAAPFALSPGAGTTLASTLKTGTNLATGLGAQHLAEQFLNRVPGLGPGTRKLGSDAAGIGTAGIVDNIGPRGLMELKSGGLLGLLKKLALGSGESGPGKPATGSVAPAKATSAPASPKPAAAAPAPKPTPAESGVAKAQQEFASKQEMDRLTAASKPQARVPPPFKGPVLDNQAEVEPWNARVRAELEAAQRQRGESTATSTQTQRDAELAAKTQREIDATSSRMDSRATAASDLAKRADVTAARTTIARDAEEAARQASKSAGEVQAGNLERAAKDRLGNPGTDEGSLFRQKQDAIRMENLKQDSAGRWMKNGKLVKKSYMDEVASKYGLRSLD